MADKLTDTIRFAFSETEYPGDWCLKGSTEGEEPYLVEKEFVGKADWKTLEAEFIDQAPEGFSSALSFFSDEAFRFYLPAYLIADVQGKLSLADPLFHLTHGLVDKARSTLINPRRYGSRTWFDAATMKFAMFCREEVEAIVAYLYFKMEIAEFPPEKDSIAQALNNYWIRRQKEAKPRDEVESG